MEAQVPAKVADWLEQHPLDEASIMELRREYEAVHFTYCMDDDVTAAVPVFQHKKFNLYLVDGRDHCLCFTTDLEIATGLVVAEKMDEEEDE